MTATTRLRPIVLFALDLLKRRPIRLAPLVLSVALASPAQAAAPVRSGSVLVAARPTYGLGPWAGCTGVPDCNAWQTTCARPVATKDGVTASIVDVRSLARSTKTRTFEVVDEQAAVLGTGVDVEFWNASCKQVGGVFSGTYAPAMIIPTDAAWMTVTAPCTWICLTFTGLALDWELR